MNGNQKFEQIWGFRRNADSSSDDSKSDSDVGNVQEKLRLVPSIFPDTDCVSETNDQRHVQAEKKGKRVRNGPKNGPKNEPRTGPKNGPKTEKKTNKREVKSKPKKDSSNIKKVNNSGRMKKKSKLISQMTVSDDFRIFTESILDDLRVARETMFAKMRKEMDQLVKSKKPISRSRTKKGKGNGNGSNQVKKPSPKPRSRKPKPVQENLKNTELSPSKGLDCLQESVKNEKAKDPSAKNPILIDKDPILIDKNPIFIDFSAKKPIFTNTPDQNPIVTSSYLTLPLVLSNSRSNDASSKLERGNYSGIPEERFRGFSHNESSCVGNGYLVGLNHHHHNRQRFDNANGFGIPNRIVQGFSHDGGNLLGTRTINGGIRYNAGLATGHTLPNHLAPNGYHGLYPN